MSKSPFGSCCLSVVVPAKNAGHTISKTISSIISSSTIGASYEVIVVDNFSVDDTCLKAKQFKSVLLIKSYSNRVGGVRHDGIQASKGDIIINTDADCILGPEYIRAACEALEDPSVGAVGGVCLNPDNATWVEQGWLLFEPPGLSGPANMLWGSSLALRREVYEEVGGFDTTIEAGEDSKLTYRIQQAGYKTLYLPECSVIHLGNPKTLGDVFRKEIWHASSFLQSKTSLLDKTFLATCVFLLAEVMFALGWLMAPAVSLAGLLLGAAVVTVFTIHRFRRSRRKRITPDLVLKAWIVDWAYFAGRSVGLLKSIWKTFKKQV
ncbi:glycosyltransferase [Hahella sp. SMD15-11]|uniref:Glycosyltransferase n=1 Tax=Thermohahella caldifontis TaxID=3142973 RepID=A0AB39UYY8_9GAMM